MTEAPVTSLSDQIEALSTQLAWVKEYL